jgi:hypothetical protein
MLVFYPSTQRHYRRLIYYFIIYIILYCYMFRSYDHHQAENILITRVTQLTTDPLFDNIANIIVIVVVMGDVFFRCITSIHCYNRRSTCPFSVVVTYIPNFLMLVCWSFLFCGVALSTSKPRHSTAQHSK